MKKEKCFCFVDGGISYTLYQIDVLFSENNDICRTIHWREPIYLRIIVYLFHVALDKMAASAI